MRIYMNWSIDGFTMTLAVRLARQWCLQDELSILPMYRFLRSWYKHEKHGIYAPVGFLLAIIVSCCKSILLYAPYFSERMRLSSWLLYLGMDGKILLFTEDIFWLLQYMCFSVNPFRMPNEVPFLTTNVNSINQMFSNLHSIQGGTLSNIIHHQP